MSFSDFQLKRNDRSTRQFRLLLPDGTAFDPTGLTLSFFFQLESLDDAGAKITGTGLFTVVDGPNGIVTYKFSAADTATAGTYRGCIEATDGVDVRETFPQDGWFTFEIFRDLGDG